MTNATSSLKVPRSTKDLAWAAGFIEGEGTFNYSTSASVQVPQKQIEPLLKLMDIFGGSIYKTDCCYRWKASASMSIQIMMTLYSLMSPKRQKEIELVLNKWKNQVPYGGKRKKGSHWDGDKFVVE